MPEQHRDGQPIEQPSPSQATSSSVSPPQCPCSHHPSALPYRQQPYSPSHSSDLPCPSRPPRSLHSQNLPSRSASLQYHLGGDACWPHRVRDVGLDTTCHEAPRVEEAVTMGLMNLKNGT